ncbi:hypothetical protein GR7B_00185 [Vibrio phage vB_VcorM_GR7B]|nr:hypothetical protein GR7B_00185 [Vibrio phage vB_VcorM_GR7B]
MTTETEAVFEYYVGLRLTGINEQTYIILDEILQQQNYVYFTIDELDAIIIQVRRLMRQGIIEATDNILDEDIYNNLKNLSSSGSGGGAVLGTQEPNTFDSGTGDKDDAETLRDTQATDDAAWLSYYDANPNVSIALKYTDGDGNRVITFQTRVGSEWLDSSSVIALKGLMALALIFPVYPQTIYLQLAVMVDPMILV